ncbi:MAG TPA: 16S rRNA (cytidine(1402)-2'-O)-methyltransferase [Polyangiales bacterium]
MSRGSDSASNGRLYVVATPIGNLEDITLRALRVLREVELVLAEDTRRSKVLLAHHGISTPLASLHAHTHERRVEQLADELAAGKSYALVTDAGTPLVSDPGRELIAAALAREVAVEALPGASAVLTALCVAGVPADQFRFVGFLPRAGKKRREALVALAHDAATTVLFESPHRVRDTLADLARTCGGERRGAVCRELTKLHEQVVRGSLTELSAFFADDPRGEIALVIEGCASGAAAEQDDEEELDAGSALDVSAWLDTRRAAGVSPKDAARELASLLEIDKREAYRRVVEHRAHARDAGSEE